MPRLPFLKLISEAQGRLRELVVAKKRPSANERAAVPEVSCESWPQEVSALDFHGRKFA
jgi:hypothetical protein